MCINVYVCVCSFKNGDQEKPPPNGFVASHLGTIFVVEFPVDF